MSNVTNFQPLLAFTIEHRLIPTKLHQILINSFRDFVCRQTNTETPAKTIPARSISGAQMSIIYTDSLMMRNCEEENISLNDVTRDSQQFDKSTDEENEPNHRKQKQ